MIIVAYTYDVEKFKSVFERSFTWLEGFERNVRRFADKPALIDPLAEREWSYAQLNGECCRLANALKAAGVGSGDLLVYQLLNSPQFAFCYIAAQKLGAVNSPISFNMSAGETARILEKHRPRVFVYDCETMVASVQALEISSHKPDVVLAVDYRGTKPDLPQGHIFYDDFVASAPETEPERDFVPDMYAETTRLFTSGTTGLAKAVPLNNVNEVLSAHDVIMHFPLSPLDITMNMTPWFHRGGLHSGGLCPTLYVGGTCVILRLFSAKTCLEIAGKYGVTFLIGVPAVLSNLASRQERRPVDLGHLKGIVTMGSPLEREACIRFQKVLTPNIFNGYGTTESFLNSFLRPTDLPEMAGSAGRSCTDDEVRVIVPGSTPDDVVPTDGETVGEIIISSWAKMPMSYLDAPELTAEKFRDGWFYTHDLGVWDKQQYISVRGRSDDMIICMGENIYPAQVEEVISSCPGVADCIVSGVPDPGRGEAVVAYVKPENESLTVKDVARWCGASQDLPANKCPRFYCLVDDIPYNATGKKQHFVVKNRAPSDLEAGLLQRP
ncbi:MAG: acyl--CoA ligase [Oscillospiraceae bacterium]|nr:acyl--CoA ligase [Oscillospiraceae bacterium]